LIHNGLPFSVNSRHFEHTKSSKESSPELVTVSLKHNIANAIIAFSHPDFTVGLGITPSQPKSARGLYRRSGITPCPEGTIQFLFSLG